jgi:autotransporter-associated beta strand protein
VDSQSTGANLTETQLTPSNVNAADFGQLYNTPVDGQVYAEPLVLTNVAISAGPNTTGTPATYSSVVFVATQHDSLYAIDAANGTILWKRSFLDTSNPNDFLPGASSVTSVPNGDVNSDDINPEIGITGTPVIDASTNILYVIAKTKETVGGDTYYVQRLHAINVGDGTDAAPAFVIGTTTDGNTNNTPISVSGTGDGNVNGVVQFNALREANRPALSLVNGRIYAEWASHGDNGPYHGWVVAWNITKLATQGMVLAGVLNTDPNGGEGGIWGGGGGVTFDPDESVNGQPVFYFETGNGDPRGGNPPLDGNGFPSDKDYYESLVKVETDPNSSANNENSNGWGFKIVDYFTPYNVNALDDADEDFGSGSPLVLPDSAGIPGHPHLIVAAGKEGTIYLLDRDNLGKFNVNQDNVLNAVKNASTGISTPPVLINGSLSTPAYYHGELYWVAGYYSNAWSYVVAPNPAPNPPTVPVASLEPTSETANGSFGYLPGSVTVSANGSEDPAGGIAWIMDTGNNELHAYSTLSLSTELWNSGPNSIAAVKFAVPTVANGQVFVGTQNSLQVFGITGQGAPAQAPDVPANVSAQALSGSAVELTWTDATVSPNFATSYAIQESVGGSSFTTVATAAQESTNYTITGLTPNTAYSFRVVGSNASGSSKPSSVATATTTGQTGQTPTAPLGLGATPASGSEVYLTWTNTAGNETGFVLTRATDSLFTKNVITETLASAPFYYTDGAAGLSPGNTYYYRLQATNAAGLSSTSNTASVKIPNVPPAATLASAVLTNGQVVVSWTDHAGPFALGYQISRSVDGGPYSLYTDRPETSDAPPSTQSFTDTNVPLGHTYSYEIVAENVAGFSTAVYASVKVLGQATVSLAASGSLVLTAMAGIPDRLTVQLASGVYTLTDAAVTISVAGAAAGSVTGAGTSAITIPASALSSIALDTSDGTDTIRIISDAVPISITADSGGGKPAIVLGDLTQNETISGTITNLSNGTMSIGGAGTTSIIGNLVCQGSGGIALAGSGPISITGNINLGKVANLTDSGSGSATISGTISGTAASGNAEAQGLLGTYFNVTAATNLIQPADPSNSAWLGNLAPDVTEPLIGPIDFPDISDNGFADNLGNPAYYNIGNGNNNVAARWYGNIMIPGSGTAPVPVNFATTSDDGSMLYIDGAAVVQNNNFQGATQATGLVQLTPGIHAIDIEYYQGGGGASMDVQWDPTGGTNFVDIPISVFSSVQAVNGLKMTGTGTLTLTSKNSYAGATTVNAGTLVISADGALGPATATGIVVNPGGALAVSGGIRYTMAEPITLSGAGPAGNGALENLSGANTLINPITLAGPTTIGSDAGTLTLNGNIAAGSSTLTLAGAGAMMVNGSITCRGGSLILADSGAVTVAGKIDLGAQGNLTDSGSGHDTISGVIAGTAASAFIPGLIGTYFNLPAAQNLIQPADSSNPAWLGYQTPAMTAQLTGPIDFPDIANNGFADSLGGAAYYNIGNGNNNVEARWYGDIMIPGSGTAPVPVNFATTSDDGSMLYIDGTAVVQNNNFQGATQATGIAELTPGVHAIDIEFYQGSGGATMVAQWDPTGGTNFVDIPNSALLVPTNGLLKTGTGALTLSATNTYAGSTTVTAGTLVVAANGALGSSASSHVVINPGGALALTGGINYTTAEPITLSGAGPAGNGALENLSGTNTLVSSITLAGPATIGADAGSMTLGGSISAGMSTLTLTGAGTTSITGAVTCQGGSVALADSGIVNVSGNIDLGTQGALVDSGSGQDTIAGVISGSSAAGSLTKTGPGTLTLSNADTYTAPTTVSGGTLVVSGHLLNSAVTVSAGGTLRGDGEVASTTVQSGGTFAPGGPHGPLSPASLSLAKGSTFVASLTNPSSGTPYGQALVPAGGTISLGNAALSVMLVGGFQPAVGQQFTIIKNPGGSAVAGTFSQGATYSANGYVFGINYTGGAGHDVVLTVLGSTSTTLSSSTTPGGSPNTSVYGQSVTFTASVTSTVPASSAPSGTVTFQAGSTVLGTVALSNGTASVTTSSLGVGSDPITATFTGTGLWLASNASLTQTVKPDPTTTAVTTSRGASVFGQSVTFTATVRSSATGVGVPTGSVTFMDGSTALGTAALSLSGGNEIARFSTASLTAGTHKITAVFGGNPIFAGSTSPVLSQPVAATPQLQNGVLAVPGSASGATIGLIPVLPKGASAYRMNVSFTIHGTTTTYGPFATSTIVVYPSPGNGAVTLNGTNGNDTFTVGTGTVQEFAAQKTRFTVTVNAGASLTLNGLSGNDGLTGPNQANVWAITGSNAGTLNGSIAFRNIANLTGGSGADVFKFAAGAKVSGALNGLGGANTLDYSAYNAPATVNLGTATTGLANRSATGVRNGAANGIANIGAVIVGSRDNVLTAVGVSSAVQFTATGNGNNILVGGSGRNTLTASGSGNNIIIGGTGASTISGGTGYNLLVGGSAAFDSVLAKLESILGNWKTVNSASTYGSVITKLTAASSAVVLSPATVHGNKNDVVRAGTHALDWYFVALASEIAGKKSGEKVTLC